MAVDLTVSMVGGSQRTDGSGHNEVNYNSLNVQFKAIYNISGGLTMAHLRQGP